MRQPDPRRGRWLAPTLLALALVPLIALLLTAWREPLLALFTQPGRLEALVARLGPLGPLAVVALQAGQVLLAPIPGQVLGLACGYLFGPWLGTLYSMVGLMLGTYLAVWLVRRWGRTLVARLLDAETMARVDRISGRLGVPLLFAIFLVPFLPDDAILLVAALAGVSVPGTMLAALFGRLPGVFLSAWIGSHAEGLSSAQWAAAVAVTLAVAVPLYLRRDALERAAWSLLERMRGRDTTGN